jgi:hypothetical protein
VPQTTAPENHEGALSVITRSHETRDKTALTLQRIDYFLSAASLLLYTLQRSSPTTNLAVDQDAECNGPTEDGRDQEAVTQDDIGG